MPSGCNLSEREKFSALTAGKSVAVKADFDTQKNVYITGIPASDSEDPVYRWKSASVRFVYISSDYENELSRGIHLYRRIMNIVDDNKRAIKSINRNMKRKDRRVVFHDIEFL